MSRLELTPEQAREALAVVAETIDIPSPATVGDDKTRAKILEDRTRHAVIFLRSLGEDGEHWSDDFAGWAVAYLRERLAENPAEGYRTWAEAVAAREATS